MPGDDFVQLCLELLAPLGTVRSRRMFGGHGIYLDDLFFALVALDGLYLKTDAATRDRFAGAGATPFVYQGKGRPVTTSYWSAPAEAMESPALMRPWAALALQAALGGRKPRPATHPPPAAKAGKRAKRP